MYSWLTYYVNMWVSFVVVKLYKLIFKLCVEVCGSITGTSNSMSHNTVVGSYQELSHPTSNYDESWRPMSCQVSQLEFTRGKC